jgi:O-methyltransferase
MIRGLDRLRSRAFELERTKRLVHKCLDRLIQIPYRLYTGDPRYAGYLTPACYSPWNTDQPFLDLFERVEPFTLMDLYKAHVLWMLVQQAAKVPGALVEVGVWRGGSGALIARRAQLSGIREPVYLCDTFTGVVKATATDAHYKGGEHADTSPSIVAGLLADLQLDNAVVLQGVFPDDTASRVTSDQIRFCHIDVDTHDSAQGILEWVWSRLPRGGIVVYDDYGFPRCDGIRTHVEEQLPAPDRLVIHNLSGQAILVKIGGH